MNKVILMGRLTKDVPTHCTSTGKVLANFTIAVRRKYSTDRHAADFINCIAWGAQAEFINNYFKKGNLISIIGRLRSGSWGEQNGSTCHSTEVLVEEVFFTGEKMDRNTTNKPNHDPFETEPEKIEDIKFEENISCVYTE